MNQALAENDGTIRQFIDSSQIIETASVPVIKLVRINCINYDLGN
jgi:hypothetical protein